MIDQRKIDRDFARDVWCIFGLPFDNYTMDEVCAFIDDCIGRHLQGVLATPNIDFIAQSLDDLGFKKNIIKSDAVVIDSYYIFKLCRFMGLSLREKIAGATLTEHILNHKRDLEYRIFIFGSDNWSVRSAFVVINQMQANLRAVGCYSPAHVPAEEMGKAEVINQINKSQPNIIFIGIGAKKSIFWVDLNRPLLNADFIANVGAAINFTSGVLKRAPLWIQNNGLEWFWRLIQEPKLWRRYSKDFKVLVWLLIKSIIPYKFFQWKFRKLALERNPPVISFEEDDEKIKLTIEGVCNNLNSGAIRESFKKAAAKNKEVVLDFLKVKYVDNSFLGLCLVLLKYQEINNKGFLAVNLNEDLKKIFSINLLNDIFQFAYISNF